MEPHAAERWQQCSDGHHGHLRAVLLTFHSGSMAHPAAGAGPPRQGFRVFSFLNIDTCFCGWCRLLGIASWGQVMFPRLCESFCALSDAPARCSFSGWGRAGNGVRRLMGDSPGEAGPMWLWVGAWSAGSQRDGGRGAG